MTFWQGDFPFCAPAIESHSLMMMKIGNRIPLPEDDENRQSNPAPEDDENRQSNPTA
jgi:hypothetical protein